MSRDGSTLVSIFFKEAKLVDLSLTNICFDNFKIDEGYYYF